MNKLKVTIAKEKILKLAEKYSKNINREEENSSSESLISIKSERSAEQEKYFQQQTSTFEKPILPNTDGNVTTGKVKVDLFEGGFEKEDVLKADLELFGKITQESKHDSAEEFFEKTLSPGSLVLSDLSNQFERIRFISSSSEDLSIVESENTQTKSTSTNIIPSIKTFEGSKKSSNDEIEFPKVRENFKTCNTTGRTVSLKSLSKSDSTDSTKISSIIESINSDSETGNIASDTSLLDSTKDSNNKTNFDEKVDSMGTPPPNNEIGELSSNISFTSILEEKSSVNQPLLVSKERIIGTDSAADSDNSKIYKSSNNFVMHKGENERRDVSFDNTSPKALNHQRETAKYTIYKNYVSQSTNTDPVKVTLLKSRSKHYQKHKPVDYLNKPTEKMEKYKHTKLRKKQDSSVKQITKRPFIKPCNLIKQYGIKNVEPKSVKHQESRSLKYDLTDDFYIHPMTVATSGMSCDEVITLLLRNQIQLTRHFMESHQRMYLQVCQAAQLLNENHPPTH